MRWPSHFRLMHVPWRFFSPGVITSISLCCQTEFTCVGGTNTKQPNLRWIGPSFSSTCHPPNPLLPLILSRCVERSLGSIGGYVDSRLAHGLIGHDSGGKLGLSLLKAGISLPVQAVDLRTSWVEHADIRYMQSSASKRPTQLDTLFKPVWYWWSAASCSKLVNNTLL